MNSSITQTFSIGGDYKVMDSFSEKSLLALGDYYVYGLIDPRSGQIFYIGKGTGNRVFMHEFESINNPDSDNLKLKTIADIKSAGMQVKKIIINTNLSENEAFAAEAALINAFNYINHAGLTNIVAGHHSAEALSVEEFEMQNGAEELSASDIRHNILLIKINRLYHRGMTTDELYDVVRGVWRISKDRVKTIQYVFGVYNSLIVAVYKPAEWYSFLWMLEITEADAYTRPLFTETTAIARIRFLGRSFEQVVAVL